MPFFPPVSFNAVVHCKTRKEQRQSTLSHLLQGNWHTAVCTLWAGATLHPAAHGKHSWYHQHGKCGRSPGASSECMPVGLCSTLFTPNTASVHLNWTSLFPIHSSISQSLGQALCQHLTARSPATCLGAHRLRSPALPSPSLPALPRLPDPALQYFIMGHRSSTE